MIINCNPSYLKKALFWPVGVVRGALRRLVRGLVRGRAGAVQGHVGVCCFVSCFPLPAWGCKELSPLCFEAPCHPAIPGNHSLPLVDPGRSLPLAMAGWQGARPLHPPGRLGGGLADPAAAARPACGPRAAASCPPLVCVLWVFLLCHTTNSTPRRTAVWEAGRRVRRGVDLRVPAVLFIVGPFIRFCLPLAPSWKTPRKPRARWKRSASGAFPPASSPSRRRRRTGTPRSTRSCSNAVIATATSTARPSSSAGTTCRSLPTCSPRRGNASWSARRSGGRSPLTSNPLGAAQTAPTDVPRWRERLGETRLRRAPRRPSADHGAQRPCLSRVAWPSSGSARSVFGRLQPHTDEELPI